MTAHIGAAQNRTVNLKLCPAQDNRFSQALFGRRDRQSPRHPERIGDGGGVKGAMPICLKVCSPNLACRRSLHTSTQRHPDSESLPHVESPCDGKTGNL